MTGELEVITADEAREGDVLRLTIRDRAGNYHSRNGGTVQGECYRSVPGELSVVGWHLGSAELIERVRKAPRPLPTKPGSIVIRLGGLYLWQLRSDGWYEPANGHAVQPWHIEAYPDWQEVRLVDAELLDNLATNVRGNGPVIGPAMALVESLEGDGDGDG